MFSPFVPAIALPETNIAPKNGWFEDWFSFGITSCNFLAGAIAVGFTEIGSVVSVEVVYKHRAVDDIWILRCYIDVYFSSWSWWFRPI